MSGRGLLVWGGGSARPALERQAAGASVVTWPAADPRTLEAAGVRFRRSEELLGPPGLAAVEAARRQFARVWPRLPIAEGRSFRELCLWRGESLLWAVEEFLADGTAAPRCAARVELCLALLGSLRPAEVDASGLALADEVLLARAAIAQGTLFHGADPERRRAPLAPAEARAPSFWSRFRARGSGVPSARPAASALVVLSSADQLPALGALPDRLASDLWLEPVVATAAGLAASGGARARRAAAQARRSFEERLRSLHGSAALAASYVHRGVAFEDLAGRDLEVLLLQCLPAAVGRIETAFELLQRLRPALVLLALDSRDERRAIGLAAQAAGVPWVALHPAGNASEEREDAGPRPAASLALGAGQDPEPPLAVLREVARARVGAP